MAKPSEIDIINLDFEGIRESLISYLKSQDRFKDYNFRGSNLSVLIDLLANNTTYNAFYLNMIGNELFLDTALHRNSVVSRAKELNYTPHSMVAPTATVKITIQNPSTIPVYLTAGTQFVSEPVGGVSYSFVAVDDYVATEQDDGSYVFEEVVLKQGTVATASWLYDSKSNPSSTFTISNTNIDTTTLRVFVRESLTDTTQVEYTLADDYLTLNGGSTVFFIQEDFDEHYQIYFGDGILGKALTHGNVVEASFIVTDGTNAFGAGSFMLAGDISGNYTATVETLSEASQGSDRETLESIKFTAPKMYRTQKRAVTDDDYVVILNNNAYGYTFDSISVWGGGNNTYVCCKPTGAFYLSENQKESIVNNILIPASVMTKQFKMVDPEYTFLNFRNTFVYNPNKFGSGSATIVAYAKAAIINYCAVSINKLNMTFNATEMWKTIRDLDENIVSYDFDLWLQKRWMPKFDETNNVTLYYDNALQRSAGNSVEVYPSFQQYDSKGVLHEDCYIIESGGILMSGHYDGGVFVKIQENIGTVSFDDGIVAIRGFIPHAINNDKQMLSLTIRANTRNISVDENRILTLDTSDDSSIQTVIEYR